MKPVANSNGLLIRALSKIKLLCFVLLMPIYLVLAIPVFALTYVVQRARIAWILRGDLEIAWSRCVQIWREHGQIDDYGPGQRPMYNPWFGKVLALSLAHKHAEPLEFYLAKTQSLDSVESVCAVEMIEMCVTELLFSDGFPTEEKRAAVFSNLSVDLPIPDEYLKRFDYLIEDDFKTLGEMWQPRRDEDLERTK